MASCGWYSVLGGWACRLPQGHEGKHNPVLGASADKPHPEPSAAMNTDREIWRGKSRAEFGDPDCYYADSLFIPQGDVEALGINCGGYVIVKPIREWHKLAAKPETNGKDEPLDALQIGDEINQCLQIIVTNAGNIAADGHYKRIKAMAKTIEEAVERAAKAVRKLATLRKDEPDGVIGARDEVGWVIEKRGVFPVKYVCAWSGGLEFTTDNLKAIRFCRREDANQIAEILESEDVAIVEHMWCAGAKP